MIIFDLDSLADDSHRRHFIDPELRDDLVFEFDEIDNYGCPLPGTENKGKWFYYSDPFKEFQPDFASYVGATGDDKTFNEVIRLLINLGFNGHDLNIWTNRNESFRNETRIWVQTWVHPEFNHEKNLKMRPDGDDTPQEELFLKWAIDLNKNISTKEEWNDFMTGKTENEIFMVFSSHKPTIQMFRSRGVFVFDCNQGNT